MKNLEKLIACLFLISCASAGSTVVSTVKAVKSCEYLHDYADDISDALNAKEYNLALNIAGNAYMRALEDSETPCLEAAKELTKQTTQFIVDSANKEGVGQ